MLEAFEASGFPRCEKGFTESSIIYIKIKTRQKASKKGSPLSRHPHAALSPVPRACRLFPMHIGNGPSAAPGAACTRGGEGRGREGGEGAFARSDHHHKELKRE